MMQVEGYVQTIDTVPTKTGKTMYNVRVNGVKYGAGMYPPKFKQGDFISFTSSMNGNFNNMETRTVTVKQPPAGMSPPQATSAGYNGALGQNPPRANSQGWDDRQDAITKQSSRNSALAMVKLLFDAGGIPGLDKAKTPADKMQTINSLVDEYTKDYYFQVAGKELELADVGQSAPDQEAKLPDNWV